MKKLTAILICLALLLSAIRAQIPVQSKAIIIKRMIQLNHFSPRAVNDSFSIDLFESILRKADSKGLIFTQPEYKALSTYRLSLDDELQGKSWNFFPFFERVYKAALLRADSIIEKLTQKPFDFSVNDSLVILEDASFNFAQDPSLLSLRWKHYLKFTALDELYYIFISDTTRKSSFKKTIDSYESNVRERIRMDERQSLKSILENPDDFQTHEAESYLDALATCFDPHTNYFSPERKQDFQASVSSEALSFGFDLEENNKGQIIIGNLIPGGPAWKSGDLNKGDELLSLQWEGKLAIRMSGAALEYANEVLAQPGADRIVVQVQKSDGTNKIVLLRKEKINNEENVVKGFVLKGEKKIGYILLPGFYTEWENESGSRCADDVAKEIVKLKKENIDGLILDVRFNGGGSLGEALEMIGIFIDQGPLTGHKTNKGKLAFLKDPNRGMIYTGPMVLMVNGQSASASEMLAASLQDYNRAIIVGSNTYGKATMQQMFKLDTMQNQGVQPGYATDIVKITTGKLYRLNGETTQQNGVKPDIILPDAFDAIEYREKFQPFALPAEAVARNSYYQPLPALPVGELSKLSSARVKADSNFLAIKKINEAVMSDRSTRKTVSLKQDSFEQWARQRTLDLSALEGSEKSPVKKFTVENYALDKNLLVNNEYSRDVNNRWLNDIGENIYIREAFMVLCDLLNLNK